MSKSCKSLRKRLPVLRLGGVCLAAVTLAVGQPASPTGTGKTVHIPLDPTPVPHAAGAPASFAPVVQKVAPAVVKVTTTTQAGRLSDQGGSGLNAPFWRRFFGPRLPFPHGQGPVLRGLGSGVVVTADGYLLTNNHVVDDAQDLKVTLQDGREFPAQVVGRDPQSDLAVIKIEAANLPVVPFADSQKVQVGDTVLAVGNPFGVGQTVTHGIVSATDRGGMGIEDYENFIQTDAAINPGNSGGALVDVEGRLIGINTAILSRSGGNQGIGFAIPSDLARTVLTSLIESGHVTRGYLGVSIQNVTPALAREFKLEQPSGALVGEVVANSPAAQAGLKDGDVVLRFNGKPVKDSRQLKLTVAETKPGSQVPVDVLRNGAGKTLQVTVGQLPGSERLAQASNSNGQDTGALKGVGVSDLNNQLRQELQVPKTVQGAVVTEVQPDSPAANAGLKPGDVIESVNRQPVKNAQEVLQRTENSKGKRTLLRVWSNGGRHYAVVNEGRAG